MPINTDAVKLSELLPAYAHDPPPPHALHRRPMNEPLHIISLGAGVQSSTMALMAAAGEITPMPSCAIFADTQDEPASVYKWLDWLETKLPFPVHRVTAGSLSKKSLIMRTTKDGRKFTTTNIPFFTRNADGSVGKIRLRGCTRDFKLLPIFRKCRELAKVKRGEKSVRVVQWIGISLDEVQRMKTSRHPWLGVRWPLIECEMSRHDCLRWMESYGYPKPPRSACVYCPYHNNAEWRRLKTEEPEEFDRAVQFETATQQAKASTKHSFRSVPFLHRSAVPLRLVDFSTDEERGQGIMAGFGGECEEMCGV